MLITVTDAKARLLDLVRRVEAGEEVVLTRHGTPVVRLTPVKAPVDVEKRLAILDKYVGSVKNSDIGDAARSHDFLYDDQGMPV
jgi:prevent-host-death family protein